ncbi:2-dehydropantoate 2-reductase family protein, putative [Penicillium digitatum PHI26]|uniref:2-dehydropantoate 2-reductase family protein, putative n=2 Tax=Penicillium digitatum TaxID=36651 RepID=K9FNZ0_PEND2|nr:2-dehydropantoate 2-reductase family protein, putative [Penicillium digitatum Pd1]EKV10894.1 2-dehydropantoate 2-reductase family protein, putative [Penicillium digitatum PHI26]EKV13216.1 2-dehydropantoate 2-reductase family protein, putative [Penicillium digitatum Pd1]
MKKQQVKQIHLHYIALDPQPQFPHKLAPTNYPGPSLCSVFLCRVGFSIDDPTDDSLCNHFESIIRGLHSLKYVRNRTTDGNFTSNISFQRWQQLSYNACLTSSCAITGLDTGRIRPAENPVLTLLHPTLQESGGCKGAIGLHSQRS